MRLRLFTAERWCQRYGLRRWSQYRRRSCCSGVSAASWDFTERDCLLLTLIHPRLAALHTAVVRRHAGNIDLTPRQWELVHLIAAGHTNRQIADCKKIRRKTPGSGSARLAATADDLVIARLLQDR
jgi:hypothetical protein